MLSYSIIATAATIVGRSLLIIVPLLLSVAYLTLAERRIIGAMQLRLGPNVTGPFGLLQPIADALKLLSKEPIMPREADKLLFFLAPVITFTIALAGWAVMPVGSFVLADVNLGVMYLLGVSSLGVYGIILAGWASNSQYAFLGTIRSAAQMISYELIIGFCILCVSLAYGSLNLQTIVAAQQQQPWYMTMLLVPVTVVFFIAALAETNRHPFDLPEAESELVAGYHVEYSSLLFALFFLGEYANMILMSAITTTLFLGGWLPPFQISFLPPSFIWFALKVSCCLFVFIWVRATLPRYRYDQLMNLCWQRLLPFTFVWFMIMVAVVLYNY